MVVPLTSSGNILRFPRAAGEPRRIGRGVLSLPQMQASCGVSPMPSIPQESTYISGASKVTVRIYPLKVLLCPTLSFIQAINQTTLLQSHTNVSGR